MNDNKEVNNNLEIDTIHLEQDYEVKAWCHMFDITKVDLKHAVDVVGPSALKVKEYLNQQSSKARNASR